MFVVQRTDTDQFFSLEGNKVKWVDNSDQAKRFATEPEAHKETRDRLKWAKFVYEVKTAPCLRLDNERS
jgi:hypothetical protein